jgi:hypothetical protein
MAPPPDSDSTAYIQLLRIAGRTPSISSPRLCSDYEHLANVYHRIARGLRCAHKKRTACTTNQFLAIAKLREDSQ